MMPVPSTLKAYIIATCIIATCITAMGCLGRLHARHRLEELAVPVITTPLKEAAVTGEMLDEILLGNTGLG